jgi:hypothetical protein
MSDELNLQDNDQAEQQEAPKPQAKAKSKAKAKPSKSEGGMRVKNLRKGYQLIAGVPVAGGAEHVIPDEDMKSEKVAKRVNHAIDCGQIEKL